MKLNKYHIANCKLPVATFLYCFLLHSAAFSQDLSAGVKAKADTLKPPVTIFLNNKPAPKTVVIPLTPAQAQGKKYTWHWGRDTIERTNEIPLAPLQTIPLPVLKNKKGEPIKPRPAIINYTDGKTITKVDSVWAGGIVLSQLPPLGGGGASSMQTFTTDNGLALDAIACGYADKSGNLWFGTYGGGVSKYDGKSFTSFTTAQGLANNVVRSITEDKSGNLWFGTSGGGVSKYDGKSFTSFTTAQGLANNVVRSITEDKSGNEKKEKEAANFAAGNKDGQPAAKLEQNGNINKSLFTNFTTADGLPDDGVTQVIEYNDKLYIGTNFGICELIPSPSSPKGYIVGTTYNSSTGYPVKDVNAGQNCMFSDSKGIIWMGTGSDKTGLVRFDPKAIHKSPRAPVVVLQSVKINEENICWYNFLPYDSASSPLSLGEGSGERSDSAIKSQQEIMTYGKLLSDELRDSITKKFSDIKFDGITKWYPLPENLILTYNHNSVSFDFVAIETGRNFLVRYQYILEGYDKEWSPITEKTSATFGNIYEGTYTFKLKARSPEGVWSEPIEYKFKVLPPWYRHWIAYVFYLILLASFIFVLVWWNGRKLRERAKQLAEKVRLATAEIREQKKHIEEKHKEVTDSINYAQRIQKAMLKEEEYISKHLPEHFILFMPKDIVSGDFYWGLEKQGHWYLAAVDCTGHGVPGAFMSMLGMSFLGEIISTNETLLPSEILNRLRDKVVKELRQTGAANDSKDGMDISLVRIPLENQTSSTTVEWAGANNALNIIRVTSGENGNATLEEIKANKQPIGYHPEPKPFMNHEITLKKGDCLYIFSDGYADQFGGPKGKKFRYKQLEELIFANYQIPMKEQKQFLREKFLNWKGALEQVDDVCIIGVRL